MDKSREDRWFRWTGWILFCVTLLAVVSGSWEMGYAWDEALAYFRGSENFREWLSQVRERILEGQWSSLWEPAFHRKYWPLMTPENQRFFNFNGHPPLTRFFPTITWYFFHDWMGDFPSYRLSPAIIFSIAVMGVFRMMARQFNFATGLFSALSLLLMPRVFGHAHIAATDTTLMAFWLFSVVAFYKGLDNKRWSYGFAVLLGLAFSIKFTALMIPLALILYMILAREKRAWRNIIMSALISPVILLVLNPTWWVGSFSNFLDHYILASLTRGKYFPIAVYYLGEVYPAHAPWHHPLVMTAVTVPAFILLFILMGGVFSIRQRADRWVLLLLSQVIFYYGVLVLTISPDYDGVRLFLPVFPFLACMAGLGFRGIRNWALEHRERWPAVLSRLGKERMTALALVLVFFWPAVQLAAIHPFYLEYYNGLSGGVAGANQKGFETTYWFDTLTTSAREKINQLPLQSKVGFFPGIDLYSEYLQKSGLLRKDLVITKNNFDYMVLIPRISMIVQSPYLMDWFLEKKPYYVIALDGIPMLLIYKTEN